jgi:hypothetical protein
MSPPAKRRLVPYMALVILVATTAGAALLARTGSVGSAVNQVRVVPLSSAFVTGQTGLPTLRISIGKDRPIKVLLDTGSVGLRVLAADVPLHGRTGISVTSRRSSVTFEDGTRDNGVLANARLRLGGLVTTRAVPLELVDSSTCTIVAQCSALDQQYGIDGTLGIGLGKPWGGAPNPLRSLPGAYGLTWQVRVGIAVTPTSTGQLVLGAALPSTGTTLQLRAEGHSSWNDFVTVCWSFGTRHLQLPTNFDTGSAMSIVWSKKLKAIGPPVKAYYAADGTQVSMSSCGVQPFWTFAASDALNPIDVITVGKPLGIAGISAFYNLIITYDAHDGLLVVTQSPSALDVSGDS